MTKEKRNLLTLVLVVVLLGIGYFVFLRLPEKNVPARNEENVITEEAGLVTLAVGQTGNYETLRVKLVSILSDSRCALGVECIWAGTVTARLELADGDLKDTYDVRDVDPIQGFSSYNFKIDGVTPDAKAGEQIKASEYKVTLRVTK